ncbi:MAG: dihydrolipoamide acetyltransferase family protein [Verrucomicrobiota bacterium]|nr:dihydrolipoamide acetyltransferase family protein [Verrucomicrobiota bacterium]
MAQAVVMPKLGQTVEESSIVKWHKKEGDSVKKGEILFEIETDKAVLEIESFFEGALIKVIVGEGMPVPVLSTVGFIGMPGEPIPAVPAPAAAPELVSDFRFQVPGGGARKAETQVPKAEGGEPKPAGATRRPATAPPAPAAPARLFISPRAKALAKERIVDSANIIGSGPNGRITVRDVEAYCEAGRYAALRITPAAKELAAREDLDILKMNGTGESGRIGVEDVKRAVAMKPRKMSKRRQIIARRLTESFTTTPHFYVTVSVDMTDLMAFRKQLKDAGQAYTVTDFILKAVILSLQEHRTVNSTTDGVTIRWHGPVQLGMAVALDEGLVVPVIRNAEDLTLDELRETARTLAEKARAGTLLPDEMMGSTFTVSNMGMMDVENFLAIINPGEGAILAVSSTKDQVAAVNGEVKVRAMMKMTLSVDHRIVDGSLAAVFANTVGKKLEDMALWKSLT